MNNEFKKSSKGDTTRYVLESGSSGGTSSGSIASVEMPVGGMQRRQGDNLIAQEASKDKVPAEKPRNFVAKNAKMGGAGQHKDKKKAEKQGDVKHKKPFMEGEVVGFPKKHRGDLSDTHECPKCGGDLQGGKYMGHAVKVCQPCKQVYLPPNSGIDQQGNKMAEDHEIQMASSELQSIAKNAEALLHMVQKYSEQEGLEAWQQSKITKAADYLNAVLQSISGEQQGVAEGSDYMMELAAKLSEKIPKNAPVDVWIKDFAKSNAPQFKGKNLAKRKQMAIAASYGAKNPSKKK